MPYVEQLTVQQRLGAEVSRNVDILGGLGERLKLQLADVAPHELPNYDWQQVYRRYQSGLRDMLTEERERAKLRLLVDKDSGLRVMSDEELELEIRQLALESVKAMKPDELETALKARGAVAR